MSAEHPKLPRDSAQLTQLVEAVPHDIRDVWFHRQFTEIQGHSLRTYGINDQASGCTNNS